MARNPRYDVLFEPVKIGPVTAPNRFYSVPHASGMTNTMPRMRAGFRGTKAEGGWGVVCTGYVSIHPTSDDSPLPYATMWDENDVRAHALMTEAVHSHGSLAGVELWHGGGSVTNKTSRVPPLSPSGVSWMATHVGFMANQRSRAMDRTDIRNMRRWQAEAARKAQRAGFDIVYVYAGMGYLPYEFLIPEWNLRTDEYGGSAANRVRLVREMLEVTREAVGDKCAVALRISLEELRARPSQHAESDAHEVVGLLAEVPDLWDVKMDSSPTDCAPSRFSPEGSHEPVIDFVRRLTSRPVVGVGRFTSPDAMVSQVRRGVLDLIGAARPSIADPFLPKKIDEGREQDIRECIGCNICIASWHESVPVRCTQNPTIGEEWRRGWHPERFAAPGRDGAVLVVGGGPAGLECALTLARRGYSVSLAEAANAFGGRLRFETALPGLKTWGRVLDWRLGQLQKLSNVTLYAGNRLSVDDILGLEHPRVVVATGARWTRMLYSTLELPVAGIEAPNVYTPDDLAAGVRPPGPIVVFDFDNYYMGSTVAQMLAGAGSEVRYVTPAGHASAWAIMTNEQPQVHRALAQAGVPVHTLSLVSALDDGTVTLANLFTGERSQLPCASLVVVGARMANNDLYHSLLARGEELKAAGISAVERIGDALAPGAIAHAVHSGHRYARELDSGGDGLHRRDSPIVVDEPLLYQIATRGACAMSAVAPIAGLEQTLPSNWYHDAAIFELEQQRIFHREWYCAGREEDIPNAGDYRVVDIVGQSILLVRNRSGALRAFFNVCRHRGAQLCRTDGSAPVGLAAAGGMTSGRAIVCPYHQWSYDLDGRLIAAPHMGAGTNFDKGAVRLYPVGIESWGGFIFVNLKPDTAQSFAAQLGEIVARTARYPLADLRIGHSITYHVAANWKSICENYNECYHCGGVHPELCSVVPAFREAGGAELDWSRGIPHREGAYTFTFSGTTRRRPFPGLDEDELTRHKGEVIYPNLFVSLARDHVAAFVLKPRHAELTEITCHFLFAADEIARPDFDPSDTVEFWDITNRQDWAICESVQRGMHALPHEHGYYAPMEDFSLDIRRYVRTRIDL